MVREDTQIFACTSTISAPSKQVVETIRTICTLTHVSALSHSLPYFLLEISQRTTFGYKNTNTIKRDSSITKLNM